MEWDATTIVLVISSLVTLVGIIPQVVQSIAFSRSDTKRVENEARNADAQGVAQFAGATQTMQGASVSLINELQEEGHTLRARNTELRAELENCNRNISREHLAGKRMLNDLILLRDKHLQEFEKVGNCPFGTVLDSRLERLIDRYSPIFANGITEDDAPQEGKPNG